MSDKLRQDFFAVLESGGWQGFLTFLDQAATACQLVIVDCGLRIEGGVSWIHVSSKDFCVWLDDVAHGFTYKSCQAVGRADQSAIDNPKSAIDRLTLSPPRRLHRSQPAFRGRGFCHRTSG